MSMYLMEDGTTKPHDEKIIELTKQRDEWKAKYLQQNKDLGQELRDPNGTIWDHAAQVARERDEARAAVGRLSNAIRNAAGVLSLENEIAQTRAQKKSE